MFDSFLEALAIKKEPEVVAAADGELIPLRSVPDEVFSSGMMGEGVAIRTTGAEVVSPIEGTLTMLFPTAHAFGITASNGTEVLVHVGLDTVNLKGKGFKKLADRGQHVKRGTPVLKVDWPFLSKHGFEPIVITIFSKVGGGGKYEPMSDGPAIAGKTEIVRRVMS